jgi:hypothetical protein
MLVDLRRDRLGEHRLFLVVELPMGAASDGEERERERHQALDGRDADVAGAAGEDGQLGGADSSTGTPGTGKGRIAAVIAERDSVDVGNVKDGRPGH